MTTEISTNKLFYNTTFGNNKRKSMGEMGDYNTLQGVPRLNITTMNFSQAI